MNRLLLALCVVVSVAPDAFVSVAHADAPAERAAKRYYDRGRRLFDLQKFDEALEQFQKAYDASPIPDFLFNIGQCQRNLGDYEAAVFSFKKFLKLDPEAPNRAKVEKLIDDLEQKIGEANSEKVGIVKKKQDRPITEQPDRPVYKKWWFWTGLAVVGAGAVGVYAATSGSDAPPTTFGNAVLPPR